jgi:hypothetical protein
MISIQDKIDKEENEQFRSIPAQRLIEKLSLLKNRVNAAKKRWFWELLQNASDYNQSVNIKLSVTDEKVTFTHDGAPFSLRDVLNLISPDSNKQEDDKHSDNIGKFGTGLVSTHILSSILDIRGLCIDDEDKCYQFSMSLDRSSFLNKQKLIEEITQTKENFKETLQECTSSIGEDGFNTSFSYRLGVALPELQPLTAADIDLDYLYEVLPYTLCFMPKVKSVVIEDGRSEAQIKAFSIKRDTDNCTDREIVFAITKDSELEKQQFAYFSNGDLSSVFRFENDAVLPFPQDLSRLFCGLPLIGTEEIGLPFILNSLKFMPTTEREGIELEPSVNETNRSLLKSSIVLYGEMLDYVATQKLGHAYNIAHLSRKYNGTQISNQQFYNLFIPGYKQHILSHAIVKNADDKFITFSSTKLPFKESKADKLLYTNCQKLNKAFLPIEDDYQSWFDAIDFTIFTDQKYTYELFAKEIELKENIHTMGESSSDIISWLYSCAEYFKTCDPFIFSKRKLLPNQTGKLCFAKDLYADINLPCDLKNIYNLLILSKNSKIGDRLLDPGFNQLALVNQEFTLEMLAKEIDDELSTQYSNNQGNTSSISSVLNKLYEWINNSDLTKERLSAYFHWYYPKRATLIVDMLTDGQREQALTIAQSGKMEALAALASSELTDEDLQFLLANIKRLPMALDVLSKKVDDKEFADSTTGDCGEEIVYKDLLIKYPKTKGFSVIWASKDQHEPCYDFEILKNGQTYCYCDAKTTKRGIANADSTPFFMRKSQWEFLQTLDESTPYMVARVFIKDGGEIKYMRISTTDFTNL